MTCDHCGAPARDEGAFCNHCGGRIKRPPAPSHRSAVAPERFDLVLADRGYAAACAHTPAKGRRRDVGAIVLVAVGVVLLAVAALVKAQIDSAREDARRRLSEMEVVFEVPFDTPERKASRAAEAKARAAERRAAYDPAEHEGGPSMLPLFFGPGALVLLGVVLIMRQSVPTGPITREVRVVVDERVAAGHRGATRYYATLQDREGRRVEYECEGWLAGRVAASDIGVAFLQGKHMIDFIRFEI